MSSQQFVILAKGESPEGMPPIGRRDEVVELLASRNIASERDGMDVLYGPGIRVELPLNDPVTQMLVTVVEEEIAWLVIQRLVRELPWKILDPVTGRELGG